MSGRSFISGCRAVVYAFTRCDEYEHYECDNGHESLQTTNEKFCLYCGEEIKVRVERELMLELALQDIRTSVFPYRLYTHEDDLFGPTCELTWYWRGRRLHSRVVPNWLVR